MASGSMRLREPGRHQEVCRWTVESRVIELGTYGIDSKTNTAWAVINYTGDFAVTSLGQ